MKKKKKIMALCLVVILTFCLTACENKGDLGVGSVLTGEGEEILAYLKGLGADNGALLTEHTEVGPGDNVGFELIKHESADTQIRRTEKKTIDDKTETFSVDCSATGKVYPGAILFANKKVLHGNPDLLDCKDLPRNDLDIKMISGKKEVGSTTVKALNANKVGEEIKNLEAKNTSPSLDKTYALAETWSDEQVDAVTGIYNASAYFGIDYKAMKESKAARMIVVFDNTYYSVEAKTSDASHLFDKSVGEASLKNQGVNKKNPGLLEVSSVDYGKRYVVTLSSNISSVDKALLAWKKGISENEINDRNDKRFFDQTEYKVFEMSNKGYNLVKVTRNLEQVNDILKSVDAATNTSSLIPLRYSAVSVTDNSKVVGNKSVEYYATNVKAKGRTRVKIYKPNAYSIKKSLFYARKIESIDESGAYKLGPWECVNESSGGGDSVFYVDSDYAEYGYAFDIYWGTDWPYADCFWKQRDGLADEIYIDLGGTVRSASIKIVVNDKEVFSETNCSSHENIFK